jgi:hypothetical protein
VNVRRLLLGAALVLLLSSCGAIRFHRAWSSFSAGDGTGMEGRWSGAWTSAWNGHSGGLRCLMSRRDDGRYLAWFYSTYAGILFFQHETVFEVTSEHEGTLHFAGEQDLGQAIGGVYRYEGAVVGDRFHAHFRAENGDHGVFEMRRVRAEPSSAGS